MNTNINNLLAKSYGYFCGSRLRMPYAGTATLEAKATLPHGPQIRIISGDRGETVSTMPPRTVHAAVLCRNTGAVLALVGDVTDPESVADAELYAGARQLLAGAQAAVHFVEFCAEGGIPGAAQALKALQGAIWDAQGANNPANYPDAADVLAAYAMRVQA